MKLNEKEAEDGPFFKNNFTPPVLLLCVDPLQGFATQQIKRRAKNAKLNVAIFENRFEPEYFKIVLEGKVVQ